MAPRQRILIFGGTFDPPHRAHVELPAIVADQLGCDRIIFVPVAISPFKTDEQPTSAEHRIAMLELAIRDLPHAEISTIELDRGDVSYTVDTLEALREQFGREVDLRLMIGADQALEFHRWKDSRRIEQLATPVVVLRPPWNEGDFRQALVEQYGADEAMGWIERTVEAPLIDVSATELRERLERGEDVGDDLDPAVMQYIAEHGLYGGAS
jgi:nicotinate-nucleotide adenylyltransferase